MEKTLEVESVYEFLLEAAADVLQKSWGYRPSVESTEIMVGNLLLSLSSLVERTLAQLRSVEKGYTLLNRSDGFFIDVPNSTSDSYETMQSRDFIELCQSLVAAGSKRLNVNFSVHLDLKKPASKRADWSSKLYISLARLLAPLTRRSKVMLIATYLGRLREALLSFKLGQVPLLSEIRFPSPRHSTVLPDAHRMITGTMSIEKTLLALVDLVIPTGFSRPPSEHIDSLVRSGWPSNPKVILTSNAYDTDDDFKRYLEFHRSNVTYVLGQHGNNYSVASWSARLPEVRSADKFLSWGEAIYPNTTTLGVIKPKIRLPEGTKRDGALLILRDPSANFHYVDKDYDNDVYETRVLGIISLLIDAGIQTRLRPHTSTSGILLDKISDTFGNSEFLDWPTKRFSLRRDLRRFLPVFTYDSTGMLELAMSGQEFLAYIPDGLSIHERFRSIYLGLRDSGVISLEPDDFMNSISTVSVQAFRLNSKQLESIHLFGDCLAKYNPRLIESIAGILRAEAGA